VNAVLAEDGHNGYAMLPVCIKTNVPLYTHFHGADEGMMLIIVTPNPDTTADTFIRQHIQLIAPGKKTAVVYFQGEGNAVKEFKTLKLERKSTNDVSGNILNIFHFIKDGYAGCLKGNERTAFINFLKVNHVRAVLAEHGQTACVVKSACKAAGVKLFAYFHGYDATAGARSLYKRYSYWRLGLTASKVFVGTSYFKEKVNKVGIAHDKIFVVPCGLMVEEFQPSSECDSNLIIAVGRMVEKKAPYLTVEAFARVVEKIPEARLEMIGDGPMLQIAKDTALKLSISNKVIFYGAKNHNFVKQKVSKAMVFVQHSVTATNGDTESLGVSLLEAMACEVPVVTTRHNGFVETIADGVTGFLVDEYDVEAMAQRITQILMDDQLRKTMGRAGRQRVIEHYESRKQARILREEMGISE